jgi:hypothetical protein
VSTLRGCKARAPRPFVLFHYKRRQGGFLHPLKQVFSAEKSDMKSRVTIHSAFRLEE